MNPPVMQVLGWILVILFPILGIHMVGMIVWFWWGIWKDQ
jgi:hypothetical protein